MNNDYGFTMDFQNAFAYRWYPLYSWVSVKTWSSNSNLREAFLNILVYPCIVWKWQK